MFSDCMILAGSTYLTYENGSTADISNGVYAARIGLSGDFADGWLDIITTSL
jgi:hypothetical protein